MKKFIVNFSNGIMRQQDTIDKTLIDLIPSGVVNYIIDTELGTMLGKGEKGITQFKIPVYEVTIPEEVPEGKASKEEGKTIDIKPKKK